MLLSLNVHIRWIDLCLVDRLKGKNTSKRALRGFDGKGCVLQPRLMQIPYLIQADISFVIGPAYNHSVEVVVLKLN